MMNYQIWIFLVATCIQVAHSSVAIQIFSKSSENCNPDEVTMGIEINSQCVNVDNGRSLQFSCGNALQVTEYESLDCTGAPMWTEDLESTDRCLSTEDMGNFRSYFENGANLIFECHINPNWLEENDRFVMKSTTDMFRTGFSDSNEVPSKISSACLLKTFTKQLHSTMGPYFSNNFDEDSVTYGYTTSCVNGNFQYHPTGRNAGEFRRYAESGCHGEFNTIYPAGCQDYEVVEHDSQESTTGTLVVEVAGSAKADALGTAIVIVIIVVVVICVILIILAILRFTGLFLWDRGAGSSAAAAAGGGGTTVVSGQSGAQQPAAQPAIYPPQSQPQTVFYR